MAAVNTLKQELIDAARAAYQEDNTGSFSVGALTPLVVNGTVIYRSIQSQGFYAQAYTDSQHNIIIAYEGTNSTSVILNQDKDLADGVAIPALSDAVDFANYVHQVAASSPTYSTSSIYVAGHSLGGAEASAAASRLSFIAGGMTFGAPGLPTAARGSVSPTNFVNYVEYLDPVGNAANDSFNPFYSFFVPPLMGAHYGTVTYVGTFGSQVVSDVPLVGFLASWVPTLGGVTFTSSQNLLNQNLGFHGLDIYAGDIGVTLHNSAPITLQQQATIYASLLSQIAAEFTAQATTHSIGVSSPSYPVVTGPSSADLLTNSTKPLSSWFSATEAPAGTTHKVDHYTVVVVRGPGKVVIGTQSYPLGTTASNVTPAQFATAFFDAGAIPGVTELAVVAFDDAGTSSVAGDVVVSVTAPLASPSAIIPSDHTPPTIEPPGGTPVIGVGSNAILSSAYLLTIDTNSANYTSSQLTYTIVAAPSHGYLLKNGSIVGFFTQADINNGLIEYQENGAIASSDSFTYFVSDPAGNRTSNATFNITVSPPPVSTHPSLTTNSALTLGVGQSAVITDSNLYVTDSGLNPWQIIYSITSGPAHGQIIADGLTAVNWFTQQQVDLGLISYRNTGNVSGPDNLAFTVSDGGTGSIGQTTFGINVIPQNNLRVVVDRALYTNPQGSNFTGGTNVAGWATFVTPFMLSAVDPGVDPANIVYTVTSMPANAAGLIIGTWTSPGQNSEIREIQPSDVGTVFPHYFTQAEVNAGEVFYRQWDEIGAGTEHYGNQFSLGFSVSDNAGNSLPNVTLPVVLEPSGLLNNGQFTSYSASVANANMVAAIGQSTIIGDGLLTFVSPQFTDDQITYSVWHVPQYATLQLNGTAINAHATFTQADIDNGRLTYVQNGTPTTSDQFGLFVTDPRNPAGTIIIIQMTVAMAGTGGGQVISGGAETLAAGRGNNFFFGDGTTGVSYANSPNGITADLGLGTVANGYGGTDKLTGISAIAGSIFNDTFIAGPGSFALSGGGGTDVVVFSGAQSAYALASSGGNIAVSGGSHVNVLDGIALAQFAANAQLLLPGATASGTTISSGGVLGVMSGSVINASIIASGGLETISSGGAASDTTISGGAERVSSGGAIIGTALSGGILEILSGGTAGSSTITISSGTLILDDSQHFSGSIAGLATSGVQNVDLVDIQFATLTLGYSGNTQSGVLSAHDGLGHAALLNMIGNYTLTSFHKADDGHGGTLVTDPPVSSGAPIATPL